MDASPPQAKLQAKEQQGFGVNWTKVLCVRNRTTAKLTWGLISQAARSNEGPPRPPWRAFRLFCASDAETTYGCRGEVRVAEGVAKPMLISGSRKSCGHRVLSAGLQGGR